MNMNIYLVEKQDFHQRGLLHDLESEYLLTYEPQSGEKIAAVFEAHISVWDKKVCVSPMTESYRKPYNENEKVWSVTSHPGRSPMLGEDNLDAAFGMPILALYALHVFYGKYGYDEYSAPDYEPVCAESVELGDEDDIPDDECCVIPDDMLEFLEERRVGALRGLFHDIDLCRERCGMPEPKPLREALLYLENHGHKAGLAVRRFKHEK